MMISRPLFLLLSLLCSILAVGVLYPGLGGDFIFDDRPNILLNGAVHVTKLDVESLLQAAYSFQPGGGSRALAMLSFAMDHWRGGLDPRVFKSTNLLIHALTVVALAQFLRSLLSMAAWSVKRTCCAALSIALIWAVHPLQVSSVLYVVQRMQTLVTLFVVLALIFYLKARQAQIEGGRSRRHWLLVVFCWSLAFASKEDALLLPAYALALELTVLDFRAARPELVRVLRRTYLYLALTGATLFLLAVMLHYWNGEAYSGRDFSSYERLLTQSRVLVTYLTQVVAPLPSNLPFYYDNLVPSRGIVQPLTTLPALILIAAVLALAWRWRQRRPVFSCGVFLFFSGHFITSNVVGLELAFEHRNHFPLIGAILALSDLSVLAFEHLRMSRSFVAATLAVALIGAGGLTTVRADTWGEPLRFARASVARSPDSVRAWLVLCTTYYRMGGGKPESPYFDQAIESCEEGGDISYSATLLGNVVIFKSIKGSVTAADWERFLERLRSVPMNVENKGNLWIMVNNLTRKIPLDERRVIETIEVITDRAQFQSSEYIRLGQFILNQTSQPEVAYRYLVRAIETASPDDPKIQQMFDDLAKRGREDWVKQLAALAHD